MKWIKASEGKPTKNKNYVCIVRVKEDELNYFPVAFQSFRDEWIKPSVCGTECEVIEWLDEEPADFQRDVDAWLLSCFGQEIARNKTERNHRFLEEAIELVQSLGCEVSEAHQLVDYVFNRPIGEPYQEVGGVMVTLAALCSANELDMNKCGQTELDRIWIKMKEIREKQAKKPQHSPLPE
jgi:hypothetical protein